MSNLCRKLFTVKITWSTLFTLSSCTKWDDNIQEKAWNTLFVRDLVLLGLSTQFKNWYIV